MWVIKHGKYNKIVQATGWSGGEVLAAGREHWTNTFGNFWQIYLSIWTNTFCGMIKYFRQLDEAELGEVLAAGRDLCAFFQASAPQ